MLGQDNIRKRLHQLKKRIHHKKMLPNPRIENGTYSEDEEMHILPIDESDESMAIGEGMGSNIVKYVLPLVVPIITNELQKLYFEHRNKKKRSRKIN